MIEKKNWQIIKPYESGCSYEPNRYWVKVIAKITKVETGEVRDYITEEIMYEGEDHPSVFNWEENNYSCDCNRELFFLRAHDEDEPDEEECSDGKYRVELINPVTNETYYSEKSEE